MDIIVLSIPPTINTQHTIHNLFYFFLISASYYNNLLATKILLDYKSNKIDYTYLHCTFLIKFVIIILNFEH